MADEFGGIQFPVLPPAGDGSVTDPGLDKLGAYLSAVLNAELGTAWGAVNPGVPFVRTVAAYLPQDLGFNEKLLPALFLERTSTVNEHITDDHVQAISDVTVMWVAQNAVQAARAVRAPGINGFHKTITRALELGRHPAWIDPGDTDDPANPRGGRGSVLVTRMGLCRTPAVVRTNYQKLAIQKGDEVGRYSAFTAIVRIAEITIWDPSFGESRGAMGATETTGALILQTDLPLPSP